MKKTKRLYIAIAMLLISATLLGTASFAWFAMNTKSVADGLEVEAYSDSLFLEISQTIDGEYLPNTTFEANNKGTLRLITHKFFDHDEMVINPEFVEETDSTKRFDGTTVYYKEADSDAAGAKKNYLYANDELDTPDSTKDFYKNVFFVEITSKENKTGTFYTKDKNVFTAKTLTDESAYLYYEAKHYAAATGTLLSGDFNEYFSQDADGAFVKATLNIDDSLEGYFFVKPGLPTPEVADSVYDGKSIYYKKDVDKYYIPALNQGSLVEGYYTLTGETAVETDATKGTGGVYYLKNEIDTGKYDYSYVGTIGTSDLLANYLYWGRAYSKDPTKVDETQTLNIIGADDAKDYYLYKELYLRQAEGTNHAKNLRVNDVKVGGAYNELTPAMRVLFVATSSASPNTISTALYDAGEDKFLQADDTYEDTDVLFEMLLGNEAETVKVEVYIYFDGKDEIAKNTDAILNGQTVEIEFTIDELSYNK